jgi:hypothetical protein
MILDPKLNKSAAYSEAEKEALRLIFAAPPDIKP